MPRCRRPTSGTWPASTSSSPTSAARTAPKTAHSAKRFWRAIRKAGLVKNATSSSFTTRRPARFWPIGSSAARVPSASTPDQPGDNCSKCGHHYSPTELIDPRSTLSGATPEIRKSPHLFIELEKLHGFLEEWTQSGEHLQPEIANYLTGPFSGRAAPRLGHLAAGTVLRLRDPRQPRQLLVRLVRRADRLHGLHATVVRSHGRDARRLVALARVRDSSLHRQGHHLFPHAVLARHAENGRLQPAGEGSHSRIPHRRRRKDVEEQGHVRGRARRISSISIRATCATSMPRSSRRASKISI